MRKEENQFSQSVLCLNNKDYLASLEMGKQYFTIPNEELRAQGYIRVIDESREDYLLTRSIESHLIHLPMSVEKA